MHNKSPAHGSGRMVDVTGWLLCALLFKVLEIDPYCPLTLIRTSAALGLFLETIYSVPPLRLKRFAVPASHTVRGACPSGVYHAPPWVSFQWLSRDLQYWVCNDVLRQRLRSLTPSDIEGDRNNIDVLP
jgi:hypothetical protein